MGHPPKRGLLKFKVFNLLSWKHEMFKVSKYKRNLNLSKVWGYQNWGFPLKQGCRNSNFLTTDARDMKFSA